MTEPAPSPTPAPSPAPSPEPAPAAQRPEWLPENHWDGEKGSFKDDFGAHYIEVANFHKTETEKRAALAARKPEDIKFDPATLPKELHEAAQKAGLKIALDEKNPLIPLIRDVAVKRGLDQDALNDLFAGYAKMQLDQRNAEMERIAAEDKKLGANIDTRKKAVADWIKGLTTNSGFTAEETEELRITAATAAGVTALEKLIAKTAGTVPGNTIPTPPPEQPKSLADRMYPNGFNPTPQAQRKVS